MMGPKMCTYPAFRTVRPLCSLCQRMRHINSTCRRATYACPSAANISPPEEISTTPVLQALANMVPGVGEASRVVISGCSKSAGTLIQALQQRGVRDILLVETTQENSASLQSMFASEQLGNALGVRLFVTPELSFLPAYLGPMDAVFLTNSTSEDSTSQPTISTATRHAGLSSSTTGTSTSNTTSPSSPADSVSSLHHSQLSSDLLAASLMLRPGAFAVVTDINSALYSGIRTGGQLSGTTGAGDSTFSSSLPELLVLEHPSTLKGSRTNLPLQVVAERWPGRVEGALLQVPHKYAFPAAPLFLEGSVVLGFGRGSRQLGTPTANIDPVPLKQQLCSLPKGVYFGWAKLDASPGSPAEDFETHKMVMNIGSRPTLNEGDEVSVEVHIMHGFKKDFYGHHLKVVALGYLRPEIRFKGLPALLNRIKQDIAVARLQLEDPSLTEFSRSL